MTQDEIIRMAREAGFEEDSPIPVWLAWESDIQRFAALVAAHEREKFYGQDKPAECANGCPKNQVCDYCQFVEPVLLAVLAEREACAQKMERLAPDTPSLAAAIRARGEK